MRVRKFTHYQTLIESRGGRVSTQKRSVDEGRAGRVFKDITLIKRGLGNQKDKNYYTEEALREGVARGLFDGLRAYVDHPTSIDEEIQPERTIRDFCGVYEASRYDERTHSVRADLRIVGPQNRWLAETIDELIAAGHGDKIGLSINGRGQTEPRTMRLEEAGGEEVEVNALQRFLELRSTDVVTEAGAGGGFSALLESARRAREKDMKETRETLTKQLREAVTKGDMPKAQKLQKKIDALPADTKSKKTSESDEDDDKDKAKGKKTREMGTFHPKGKKKRPMYEAREDADQDDVDDEDDDEQVDHDAELDAAAREAADGRGDEDDEDDVDDEDDEDLEESDEDDEDDVDDEDDEDLEEADDRRCNTREADRGRRDDDGRRTLSAVERLRRHDAAVKEARGGKGKIKNAIGKPTGTVTSGDGKFNRPAKFAKKGSNIPQPPKTLPWGRGRKKKTREARVLVRENEQLREANLRLRADLTRRQTADRAKNMLRESNIPPSVRPTLIPDMIGMSEAEMRRFVTKQERILESMTSAVREDLGGDDFDEVEGNGSPLRESHFYGRGDSGGDDIAGIFADVGLPMKS